MFVLTVANCRFYFYCILLPVKTSFCWSWWTCSIIQVRVNPGQVDFWSHVSCTSHQERLQFLEDFSERSIVKVVFATCLCWHHEVQAIILAHRRMARYTCFGGYVVWLYNVYTSGEKIYSMYSETDLFLEELCPQLPTTVYSESTSTAKASDSNVYRYMKMIISPDFRFSNLITQIYKKKTRL